MKDKPINTLEQATAFLETIDLEAIQTDGGWILHGARFANSDFELSCDSDTDLIAYARGQRDLLRKSLRAAGVNSVSELPADSSESPAAQWRDVLLSAFDYSMMTEDRQEEDAQ